MASPTVDHNGVANATNTVLNITLPSASSGEFIVIAAYCSTARVNTQQTISSISGGGLTFARAARSHGSSEGSLDVWTAKTSGELGSTTFSVTFSGTYDDASAIVFGVNNANSANPLDPNTSMPATYFSNTNATPSFSGISTTNADDLLFMVVGANNSNTLSSPPTGWTLLANTANGGGAAFSCIGAATLSLSATVSGQTYSWGQTVSTSQGTEGVLLAFTADAPSGGGGSSARRRTSEDWFTL